MRDAIRENALNAARELTRAAKRNIVIGVMLAMFLATLDSTIVAPALPTIGASLGGATFLPWIVSAYFLTSTAVTPLYGKMVGYPRPPPRAAVGAWRCSCVGSRRLRALAQHGRADRRARACRASAAAG